MYDLRLTLQRELTNRQSRHLCLRHVTVKAIGEVGHKLGLEGDKQIDLDTKIRQLQTEMRDLLQQKEASKQELKALSEKFGYNL